MPLTDDLFMPFNAPPSLKANLLAWNQDIGKTILMEAVMLKHSNALIRGILRKYPEPYEALRHCKLIHFKETLWGNTPLMWAIANTSIDAALTLLDKNVISDCIDMATQINMPDKGGKTPLMFAVAKGASHQCDLFGGSAQRLVIERLLTLSADVTIQNKKKQTALHYAAAHRDIALMKKLVAAGGDLTHPDENGNTPLHMTNFTEQQADAFLYDARVFTRDSVHWYAGELEFRTALDDLVGQSTKEYVPFDINLPLYPPAEQPCEEGIQRERKRVSESHRKALELALLLYGDACVNDASVSDNKNKNKNEIDAFFYLKCFSDLAMVFGSMLLVLSLLFCMKEGIILGGGILGLGGIGYFSCQFFNNASDFVGNISSKSFSLT